MSNYKYVSKKKENTQNPTPLPSNYNLTENIINYKNAVFDWQKQLNNHNESQKGEIFTCVQPPEKPKLEDYV